MNDQDIVGVEIWFDEQQPLGRYILASDQWSPRLNEQLIDELLDAVDIYDIEREAMSGLGVGQNINLAARTLEALRKALHAELHGVTEPSDPRPSPPENQVA